MRIDPAGSSSITQISQPTEAGKAADGFGDALSGAVKDVSRMEAQANEMGQQIAGGDLSDMHNAMVAMQKASMALDLTVQVRNKVLDAYQEIMRMQV